MEATFGPRVNDPKRRSSEQLKKEKARLDQRIRRAQAAHGGMDIVELAHRAEMACKKYESAVADLKTVQEQEVLEKAAFKDR